MKLETIWIKNFGPFHETLIDLRGVSSATICGPNGAGKSIAFYESIMWCLWKVCRLKDPDAFIRLGETDMSVSVTAAISGQVYRFSRARSVRTKKGKSEFSIEVAEGEKWVPVAKTTEALLQIDHDVLTSSNFLGFGEGAKICKATATARINLLCEILGITRYSDYASLARKAGDVARGELTALLPQQDELAQAVIRHDEAVAKLKEAETRRAELVQAMADGQKDVEAKIHAKAQAEAALAAMGESQESYHQTQVALLTMTIERLETKIAEMNGLVAREPALRQDEDHLHSATQELTRLRPVRDTTSVAFREAEQDVERTMTELQALRTQHADMEKERTKLDVEQQGLRQRIAEYEHVIANDQERAPVMASLQTIERRMGTLDNDIAQAVTVLESCDVGYRQVLEDEKAIRETLAQALSQQKIAEGLREQWVTQYQRETATLKEQITKARSQVGSLEGLPCGTDLQRQCKFVKSALQVQEQDLPALEAQLVARVMDPLELRVQAPYDAETHAVQARTQTVRLEELNVEWFRQSHNQATMAIAELRQTRAALEQEAALIRKQLPDAAYLAKATAEIPELQKASALKESALASVLKDLEAVQAEILATGREEKTQKRNALREVLLANDESMQAIERDVARWQAGIEDLPKVLSAKESLPWLHQDLEGKRVESTKAEAELVQARTHATRKEQLAKDVELASVWLLTIRSKLDDMTDHMKAADEDVSMLRGFIRHTCEAKGKLESLAKRCAEQESTIQRAAWLLEAYKRVPILMIENALPVIEAEANRALHATSSKGMSLKLETQKALKNEDRIVDAMDILVRDEKGERPYECYSGGEGGLIEFAMRLGVSRLSGSRCIGPKIETLVIDEGFSAMDNDFVLPRMRKFLSELANEYPLMLIITHNQEFKGTLGAQITVAEGAEGSTVEIA